MKKSREERRIEAAGRAKSYTWANSKAKRLGTSTEKEWSERNSQISA